jgi:hypothetical protein
LPRWGKRVALGIEPLEVEQWLKALKREKDLQNPTLDKQQTDEPCLQERAAVWPDPAH